MQLFSNAFLFLFTIVFQYWILLYFLVLYLYLGLLNFFIVFVVYLCLFNINFQIYVAMTSKALTKMFFVTEYNNSKHRSSLVDVVTSSQLERSSAGAIESADVDVTREPEISNLKGRNSIFYFLVFICFKSI